MAWPDRLRDVHASGDCADTIPLQRRDLAPPRLGLARAVALSPSNSTWRILAIPGSLRTESYNRRLLEAARELAPAHVEVELWGGLKRVPPFDEDDENDPGAAVLELRDAIAQADAVLIATPEYNSSLPGQLKNALDWASRPRRTSVLRGKPLAVIGAGPRPSAAERGVGEARVVLGAIGARVLDAELAVARVSEQFDDGGRLAAVAQRRDLKKLLERLVDVAADARRELVAA
jgi:chromate reductase, NAD(P)H dehydrogenase (quinone)